MNESSVPGRSGRSLNLDLAVGTGSLGIVLNSLVLLVLYRNTKILATNPLRIVINQSLVDAVVGLFLVWGQFQSSYVGVHLPDTVGPSPEILCHLLWSTYMIWACIDASSFNLMLLTVERYLSVCHPYLHRKCCTTTAVTVATACTWVLGFLFASAAAAMVKYNAEANTCIWAPPALWMVTALFLSQVFFTLLLPALVMTYSYVRIYIVLRNRVPTTNQQEENKVKQNKSFIATCVLACGAYQICFCFNKIYVFLYAVGALNTIYFTSAFYQFTVLITFANCAVNPVIYAIRIKAFRQELYKILPCSWYQKKSKATNAVHTDTGKF